MLILNLLMLSDVVINVHRFAGRHSLTSDTVRVRILLVSDTRSLCFSKAVKRSIGGHQAKLTVVMACITHGFKMKPVQNS